MITYPYGYFGERRTEAALDAAWTWKWLHPELRRRCFAMFRASQAEGHDVGCGGGARDPASQDAEFRRRHFKAASGTIFYDGSWWRRYSWAAPFAPPGHSNHETGILEGYALAIDTVGWEDGWQESNCHRFGLYSFSDVNDEPWHLQPVETAASRIAVDAQVFHGLTLPAIPLPGDTPTPAPEPEPEPEPDPPVPPTQGDIVEFIIYPEPDPNEGKWYNNATSWIVQWQSGRMTRATNAHVAYANLKGIAKVPLNSKEQYLDMIDHLWD